MINIIAVITPFLKNGIFCWINFLNLINYYLFNKVKNFLFFGTTGESFLFSNFNYYNLSKFFKKIKIKFFFGICKINIKKIIKILLILKLNNIISILIPIQSYILPNNLTIFKYLKTIKKIGIPVILYNIPKRTGIKIKLKFLKKILKNNFIFSIKNSFNNKNNILLKKFKIIIFSGEDFNLLNCLKNKFSGTISVYNNIFPKMFNFINNKMFFFLKKFNLNKNPIFIKYLLYKNSLIYKNSYLFDILFFFFTQSQI